GAARAFFADSDMFQSFLDTRTTCGRRIGSGRLPKNRVVRRNCEPSPGNDERPLAGPCHFTAMSWLYGDFGGCTRTRTLDPLIKSQLLYHLSYAPVFEDRHQSGASVPRDFSAVQPTASDYVDNISRTLLDPHAARLVSACVCPAFRPQSRKMSRATVTEGVQLQHIVTRLRLFGTEIVHQAYHPL